VYALLSLTFCSWPPYPPPEVWFYKVPYGNMILKFLTENEDRDRNQAAVATILQDAIRDAITPFRPNTPMPNGETDWEDQQNNIYFGVTPKKSNHDQDEVLTYGLWTTALTGIKAFVQHYPWLLFRFEIYEIEYDREGHVENEYMVGVGQLTTYVIEQTSQSR